MDGKMEMDGFLWMLLRSYTRRVNEKKGKQLEGEVQKKQGGWYL